jgi:hypothetical protein
MEDAKQEVANTSNMGTKEHQNKCKHDDNYCPQIMS